MDNVATMPAERRMELFRETAAQRSLSVDLIEKDFWVCWSLYRLFSRMADLPATPRFQGRDVPLEGLRRHRAVFRGR